MNLFFYRVYFVFNFSSDQKRIKVLSDEFYKRILREQIRYFTFIVAEKLHFYGFLQGFRAIASHRVSDP